MAVYCFGKINVLRFDLKESREGFCRRGRGMSFHVEVPKTEKAREQYLSHKNITVQDESERRSDVLIL